MTHVSAAVAAAQADTTSGQPRFLALGDSYTIGEAVGDGERWPMQLVAQLRAGGTPVADPEIIALTGWTTSELTAGIAARGPQGPYALVTLLIGVNDQYRGRPGDAYRAELHGLLQRGIGFAGGDPTRVLVVSIPDWGITPFAQGRDAASIGQAIDRFNGIGREEATAAGASFVDITPTSREFHPDWEANDGLHPSGAQYAAWTRLILPEAARVLRRRP